MRVPPTLMKGACEELLHDLEVRGELLGQVAVPGEHHASAHGGHPGAVLVRDGVELEPLDEQEVQQGDLLEVQVEEHRVDAVVGHDRGHDAGLEHLGRLGPEHRALACEATMHSVVLELGQRPARHLEVGVVRVGHGGARVDPGTHPSTIHDPLGRGLAAVQVALVDPGEDQRRRDVKRDQLPALLERLVRLLVSEAEQARVQRAQVRERSANGVATQLVIRHRLGVAEVSPRDCGNAVFLCKVLQRHGFTLLGVVDVHFQAGKPTGLQRHITIVTLYNSI